MTNSFSGGVTEGSALSQPFPGDLGEAAEDTKSTSKLLDHYLEQSFSKAKTAASSEAVGTAAQSEMVGADEPGGVGNVATHLGKGFVDQVVNHTDEVILNGAIGAALTPVVDVGLKTFKKTTWGLLAAGGLWMLGDLAKHAPKWGQDIATAYNPYGHSRKELLEAEAGLQGIGKGTANLAANTAGIFPGSMLSKAFLEGSAGKAFVARFGPKSASSAEVVAESVANKNDSTFASPNRKRPESEQTVEQQEPLIVAAEAEQPKPLDAAAQLKKDAKFAENEAKSAAVKQILDNLPDEAIKQLTQKTRRTTDADGNKYLMLTDESNPSERTILVRDKDNNVKGMMIRGEYDASRQAEKWMIYKDGTAGPWEGPKGVLSNEISLITTASKADHPFQKPLPKDHPLYAEFETSGENSMAMLKSTETFLQRIAAFADKDPALSKNSNNAALLHEIETKNQFEAQRQLDAAARDMADSTGSPSTRLENAFHGASPENLKQMMVDKAASIAEPAQRFMKEAEGMGFYSDPKGRRITTATIGDNKVITIHDKDGNPILTGVGRLDPTGSYEKYSFKIGERFSTWTGGKDNIAELTTNLDARTHPLNLFFAPRVDDYTTVSTLAAVEKEIAPQLDRMWKGKEMLENMNSTRPVYREDTGAVAVNVLVGHNNTKHTLSFFSPAGGYRGSVIRTHFDDQTEIGQWVAVDSSLKPFKTWETTGDTKAIEKWLGENTGNRSHPLTSTNSRYNQNVVADESVPEVFRRKS